MALSEVGGGRFRLREDAVTWREMDGEVIALASERNVYLSVNPAGTMLWCLLAEGCAREELVDALASAYALPAERAGADVDAFLTNLLAQGLLER